VSTNGKIIDSDIVPGTFMCVGSFYRLAVSVVEHGGRRRVTWFMHDPYFEWRIGWAILSGHSRSPFTYDVSQDGFFFHPPGEGPAQ
jgi:hypothetical protein